MIAFPTFKQSDFTSQSDTVRFNMKSGKGLTKSTYTQQGEMYVYGQVIKKVNNDVFYALRGRFTTCNLDTPHFAFISNKIKFISPFLSLIQSVDSLKLLQEINRQAEKNSRVIDCLLQIYIATEETKFGLSSEELFQLLESEEFKSLKNIRIRGLMGMATNSTDENKVRNEFKFLKELFIQTKEQYFKADFFFNEISMGMSADYKIALEEGATLVRLGSVLFGER